MCSPPPPPPPSTNANRRRKWFQCWSRHFHFWYLSHSLVCCCRLSFAFHEFSNRNLFVVFRGRCFDATRNNTIKADPMNAAATASHHTVHTNPRTHTHTHSRMDCEYNRIFKVNGFVCELRAASCELPFGHSKTRFLYFRHFI